MTGYVLGFAFDSARMRVALIEKNRPDWQLGKLNGIGGHIEQFDTTPFDAMQREFSEEAGLNISTWVHHVTMRCPDWVVYVFYAHNVGLHALRESTDERLVNYDVENLPPNVLPNLRWLIPLALMRHDAVFALSQPVLAEVTYR